MLREMKCRVEWYGKSLDDESATEQPVYTVELDLDDSGMPADLSKIVQLAIAEKDMNGWNLISAFSESKDYKSVEAFIPQDFQLRKLVRVCDGAILFPNSGKKKKSTRRRKRAGGQKPQNLTEKQMEAVKLHGECEGNIAEVGRRMGIDRKSAEQHINAGFGKLGKSVPQKAQTQKHKRGKRGEDDVAEEDDKRR